jgi:transposase InsO family protein
LRIKNIRSDNGTEFKNSQIEGFLEKEGIKHEFSSPYTPQQNGVVERKNRTLLDMARAVMEPPK